LNIALNSNTITGRFTSDVVDIVDEIRELEPALYDGLRLFEIEPDVEFEDDYPSELGEVEDEENPRVKQMELQPFEHYDYVVIFCKNTHDWFWLQEKLKLEKVDASTHPKRKKIGLGRAISVEQFRKAIGEN